MTLHAAVPRRRLLLGMLGGALAAACGDVAGTATPVPVSSPSPSPPAARPSPSPSPAPSPGASPSPAPIALGRPGLLAVVVDGRILVVDPNGQPSPRTVVASPDNAAPRWSPDGRSVAYLSGAGPSAELRLVPTDGGLSQRLTSNARPEHGVVWSPRGDRVAYSLARALGTGGIDNPAEPEEIWVLDVQTGADRKVADGFDPAWSPDGRRLVYASNGQRDERGPRDNAIRIVGEDGRGDRQVLAVSGLPADLLLGFGLPFRPMVLRLRAPSWSPDGQRLVASADGHTGLAWTFDERGQSLQPWALAYEGGVGRARWSPDGARLAIESSPATAMRTVVLVEIGRRRETTIGGPTVGFQASGPAWAPDGRRLAMIASRPPARRSEAPESALRLFGPDGASLGDLIAAPGLRDPDWGRLP
jgi:Tol biopolymer transport system component